MDDILTRSDGTRAPIINTVTGFWACKSLRSHEPGEHFELRNSNLPADLVFVPNVAELANYVTDYTGFADGPNAEFVDVMDGSDRPTLRMALQCLDDGPSREGMVLVKYGAEHKPGDGLPSKCPYEPEDKLLLHPLPRNCTSTEELSYWEASELVTKASEPSQAGQGEDSDDQDEEKEAEGDVEEPQDAEEEEEEEEEEVQQGLAVLSTLSTRPRRSVAPVDYVNLAEENDGPGEDEQDEEYNEEESEPEKKKQPKAKVTLVLLSSCIDVRHHFYLHRPQARRRKLQPVASPQPRPRRKLRSPCISSCVNVLT